MDKKTILDPPSLSTASAGRPAEDLPKAADPATTERDPQASKTETTTGPDDRDDAPATLIAPTPPATQAPLQSLPDEWRTLARPELAHLCARAGLKGRGTRRDLIKRLEVRFLSPAAQQIHGRTRCRYCGEMARVTATRRLSDTVIERYYTCRGKRTHTFKIQENVPQPPAGGDAGAEPPAPDGRNLRRFLKRDTYL